MGRFRIQLLLEDNTWSTRYNIPKNDRYSDSSTHWTKLRLFFIESIHGIKLLFDQIDTPHADMCFSETTITHSVYYMKDENCFNDMFEPIPDYRKIVLLIFLVQNDDDLLNQSGFLKGDIDRLNKEFKTISMEQNEVYLDYFKKQEESIIEKILNK